MIPTGSVMPTGRTRLFPVATVERDELQPIFNEWPLGPPSPHEAAGVPPWLAAIQGPNPSRTERTFRLNNEWDSTLDVLWVTTDGTWIGELKPNGGNVRSNPQPMGLPQILYYAWVLERLSIPNWARTTENPDRLTLPIRPFLVTNYSWWIRGSIEYLTANGFRKDALTYLVFHCFERPTLTEASPGTLEETPEALTVSTPDHDLPAADVADDEPAPRKRRSRANHTPKLLWFDDPLADWQPSEQPPVSVLPASYASDWKYWYWIRETETWTGVRQSLGIRPILWTVPYVMVSQRVNNAGALVWQRNPNGLEPGSREGEFYLYRPGQGKDQVPTPPPDAP